MKKTLVFVFIYLLVSSLIVRGQYKGEKCIVKSEFIYQQGDVTFLSCHASTLAETERGGLLAAWFGGTAEKNPDVGIWVSIFASGGWSLPVEVANGIQHKSKRYPCWNPVLYNSGKEILLFYKVGPSPSSWWGELVTSEDNGNSWSLSRRLPEDISGPVKNKPVLLNGELLCPSSTENNGWRVHMEMTSDNGQTWERTSDLNEKIIEAIQPTLLIYEGEKIQMLCRSKQSQILTAWSKDRGRHWSPIVPFGLPNPNSGIDAVTLKNGQQLLVYNHLITGRNMLNVAVSDDGNNWKAAVLLENGPKASEYSYPAVIQTIDGLVHITYTWNRKQIKHVVIDPSKIETKPIINNEWPL